MWFVGILAAVLYIALIVVFFWYLLWPLFLAGSAIMIVLVSGRYFQALGENLIWGTGVPEQLGKKEPAYYNYFFDKAWRDYARIVVRAQDLIRADMEVLFGWGRQMLNPLAWPMALTLWLVTVFSGIPAVVNVFFLGLLHIAIVAIAAGMVYVSAGLLFLIEKLNLLIREIHGRCPECHHSLGLPVYLCPCGVRHMRLIPGAYGSIYRRCQCGNELPTLFLFGRNLLHSRCRGCDAELNSTVLTVREVFVPIVGGISSGKTSLITATLAELEKKESGVKVTFLHGATEKASVIQREYTRWREQYLSGQRLMKTTDDRVRVIDVCLEESRGRKRLLYAYDAAGEVHLGEHVLGTLPYWSHIDGLVLLVDPFSLTSQRPGPSTQPQILHQLAPSPDSPQGVFDQVRLALARCSKRGSIANVPMAVVVTKTDAFGLRNQILATPVPPVAGEKPLSADEMTSRAVRQWLSKNGGQSVINSAETHFHNVRYFECSALGRIPDGQSRPFQAQGVLDPWEWIMGKSGLTINVSGPGVAP